MPEDRSFDDYYTIEFYGPKGWELFQTHSPRNVGILEMTQTLLDIVVNDRENLQWRLTTPRF